MILLFHKFPILFFQVLVPTVGQMLEESSTAAGVSVSAVAILCCLVFGSVMEKVVLDKRKSV